ncbi:uncharacterized protein LOC117124449 [Anneissia japonica]|uniref:uncharacterized protein LOC117124449 n=1 Tax=Anneissia japonica TaxID=1529436 RepID=UPI00142550DA|nr:uncharacterized protein LOC117124449 [Anneissia japonica]
MVTILYIQFAMAGRVVLLVVLTGYVLECMADGTRPMVQAKFGNVLGRSVTIGPDDYFKEEKTVDVYRSIPYAEPPVGPLRFMSPVAKSWDENSVFDATGQQHGCLQAKFDILPIFEDFSEDCLQLDVYTPNPRPVKAPVMVFIHGGGFAIGIGTSGNLTQVPMVAVGDVIVVNINYRLNVFGFFSTGDDVVSGNMGLKDQTLALQWVHDNIAEFGGDPEMVTIYGESAGSMSVTYHTVSPMSKGLFHRAIMQSGTIIPSFHNGEDTKDLQRSRAFAFGRTLGCNQTNTKELVKCLQSIDSETLFANYSVNTAIENGESPLTNAFSPNSDGQFMLDDPSVLLDDADAINDVDVMLGSLADEGSLFVKFFKQGDIFNRTHMEMWASTMLFLQLKTELARETTILFYLTDEQITHPESDHTNSTNQLIGDMFFVCPTTKTAQQLTDAGKNVFLYHMTHVPSRSFWNMTGLGAAHGDDLIYVFGMHYNEELKGILYGLLPDEEIRLTHAMLSYWTNFAKTGDPNNSGGDSDFVSSYPEWPKFSLSDHEYKEISTSMRNGNFLKPKECSFFNDIFPKIVEVEEKLKKFESEENHEKTKYTCQSDTCDVMSQLTSYVHSQFKVTILYIQFAMAGRVVLLVVLIVCVLECMANETRPMVQAKFGNVLGRSVTIGPDDYFKEEKTVDVYRSIPYAEPPVGPLRFMSPVAKSWDENSVFDATGQQHGCLQAKFDMVPIFEDLSEDCLQLDVYTPNPRPVKAPVMVFIHGGGFVIGIGTSGNLTQVPMVAVGDVIVVNINYRLNVFGFFSTGDDVVSGNMGFKDQTLALQWVHDNIAEFGGDPEMVTIYGESAGSVSVTYHTVSPMSKGLFHRAIMQSGTSSIPSFHNGEDTKDLQRSRAFAFGRTLGCNQTNTKELVKCLQSIDSETLFANYSVNTAIENGESPITNVFSPNSDGQFMLDDPSVLLDDADAINVVDVMLGSLADEGSFFVRFIKQGDIFNRTHMEMWTSTMLLQFKTELARETTILFYLTDEQITHPESDHTNSANQLMGDMFFVCPTMKTAQQLADARKNVFLYHMTHVPSRSVWNMTGLGAAHGVDLIYVFGMHYNEELKDIIYGLLPDEEIRLTHAMLSYWTNFAKTGDPNNSGGDSDFVSSYPEWPKFSLSDHEYKEISTSMRNGNFLKPKECSFFNDIFPKMVEVEEKLKKFESGENHEKTKYTCQSDTCDGEDP